MHVSNSNPILNRTESTPKRNQTEPKANRAEPEPEPNRTKPNQNRTEPSPNRIESKPNRNQTNLKRTNTKPKPNRTEPTRNQGDETAKKSSSVLCFLDTKKVIKNPRALWSRKKLSRTAIPEPNRFKFDYKLNKKHLELFQTFGVSWQEFNFFGTRRFGVRPLSH